MDELCKTCEYWRGSCELMESGIPIRSYRESQKLIVCSGHKESQISKAKSELAEYDGESGLFPRQ